MTWHKVSFISNTSYFYHKDYADLDYTTYFAGIFNGDPLQYLPGDAPSQAYIYNRQNAFTEEARLQSNDKDALLDWIRERVLFRIPLRTTPI